MVGAARLSGTGYDSYSNPGKGGSGEGVALDRVERFREGGLVSTFKGGTGQGWMAGGLLGG